MEQLRALARRALTRMYRPERGLFAFRLRRDGRNTVLEGISRRYTAITLIGLANETREDVTSILHGREIHDVCRDLLKTVEQANDLGEVALTLWAAWAIGHPDAARALDQLKRLHPEKEKFPTVEMAWSLKALLVGDQGGMDIALVESLARRLMASFRSQSALFPHWPADVRVSPWRAHVACFADQVYPIQALTHYYEITGDERAKMTAGSCAEKICSLQGDAGQWWWHYDVRTGHVLEGYPVYSVHQDAMAPMALLALENTCGISCQKAVEKGLDWLMDPPETRLSLWDKGSDIIWRKVARHEPGKLVRSLQATASRVHPRLRLPVNRLFPPGFIDYESRPYHMGWILHAWGKRGI